MNRNLQTDVSNLLSFSCLFGPSHASVACIVSLGVEGVHHVAVAADPDEEVS